MSKKPNILLITSDQQHTLTLGVLNPEIKTPHLDRLAAEGTLFTRAYCPNPTCSPTRASMITGMYPSQHGCYALGTKLPETVPTVGSALSSAGYHTALVGKAHFQPLKGTDEFPSLEAPPMLQDLDFWRTFRGPFYGFDHVELARNHADEYLVGQHYAIWLEENGCANWRDYFQQPTGHVDRPQKGRWAIPERFHYNTWISEKTLSLLDDYHRSHQPFFLWASFFDPHPPYLVPEPWDTMYDPDTLTVPRGVEGEHDVNPPHFKLTQEADPDFSPWQEPDGNVMHGCHSHLPYRNDAARHAAWYYGMVSLMDKYIGRIMDRLDAMGLSENTLVVFTSDHGHLFGQHDLHAKGPFHYEDLLRVPFMVRQPGTVPAGERSDALQSLVDLAPSFLSAAGLPVPRTMTGIDQVPTWQGEREESRDHVIVENRHQPSTMHLRTYIDRRYKITVYYQRDYGELFDLEADPGEFKNLWDEPECRDLKARLITKLLHAELGNQPCWMPRITHA